MAFINATKRIKTVRRWREHFHTLFRHYYSKDYSENSCCLKQGVGAPSYSCMQSVGKRLRFGIIWEKMYLEF